MKKFIPIRKSIQKQMLVLLIVVTAMPILLSMVIVYQDTTKSIKRDVIEQNRNLFFQGKTYIEDYFNGINRMSSLIYNQSLPASDSIFNFFRYNDIDKRNERIIESSLWFYYGFVDQIIQVNMYFAKDQYCYTLKKDLIRKSQGVTLQKPPATTEYGAYIEPPHPITTYGNKHTILDHLDAKKQVITFHRPIYDIPYQTWLGTVSLDIDIDKLSQIFDQMYQQGEELWVVDMESNLIIYSPDQKEWGSVVEDPWASEIKRMKNKGTQVIELNESNMKGIGIYEKIQTPYMNWVIIKYIPNSSLYQSAQRLQTMLWKVLGLSLSIVILIAVSFSLYFTYPIRKLLDTIKNIRQGDLKAAIKVDREDEFGSLQVHFNEMMDEINQLIINKYQLEIANQTMQLKALQAQIDPHFLNNTLQMIGTHALKADAPQAYQLILQLSQMMRYNMQMKEMTVYFRQEVEHVQTYLELQKERFGDSLTCQFYIDEKARDVQVPKMLLQPIVENYFKHGFDQTAEQGFIGVYASIIGERMRIVVEDRGIGFTVEECSTINEQLSNLDEVAKNSIGLCNVSWRLQLFYGKEEAQMYVENAYPTGAQIVIEIPTNNKG